MIGWMPIKQCGAGAARALAVVLMLAALAGCASSDRLGGGQPADQAAATPPSPAPPPPPPTPPAPPPVDLAGKWKLAVAGSGGCFMTLTDNPGAAEGAVAPAGGCPGNFFTSRKWTYEHDRLIIRDHKGEVLVELAFDNGRFAGKDLSGGAITLVRP
jgi:hypothetical protein